jgi:hypothetical protein
MSRFKIFQVDVSDPASFGRKNRRVFFIYSIIPTAILLLFNIYNNFENKPLIILVIILPAATIVYIYLIWRLRRSTKQLKTIGDIEFTTSGIKKSIGDSLVEFKYPEIKRLEVEEHIPATSMKDTKGGYFSYILKIIFSDGRSESLVVSEKSFDSRAKLSIIETLKTLKKMVGFEIRLP